MIILLGFERRFAGLVSLAFHLQGESSSNGGFLGLDSGSQYFDCG
jgi:hypothetical protein